MTTYSINVKKVNVNFDTKHGEVYGVKDVSINFLENEVTGIIGESGSGKSLLGMSIIQLLSNEAKVTGECYYADQDLISLNKHQIKNIRGREIGFIPQNPDLSLNPILTIGRQLREPYKIHRIKYENKIDDFLSYFALDSNLLDRYPFQISGGEAQRLSIIKCLTLNPSILILDEPTSMLDVSIQAEIINFLLEVQQIRKMTFIFVSHDLELVSKVCDEIIVIDDKKIIEYGNVNDILGNPQNEYTKDLIESFEYFYE